jgi:PKD repeat protein
LPQNAYYSNGEVNSPLVADFIADNTAPPRTVPVTFIDQCSGNPTSWYWTFDRNCCITYLNNTNCYSEHPQVQFNEGGPYSTTLTVFHNNSSSSKTKVSYIQAGIPGFWNGDTSNNWTDETNWDNWKLPAGSTDVVIPAAATYWPVFNGNLTIGHDCKTIKLESASSQLTVTGDIIIQ